MIKVIERMTFRETGETKETIKEFPSLKTFHRILAQSQTPAKVKYDLKRFNEATIEYVDGTVHMKVIEVTMPESKIVGLDGRPIGLEP